MPTFQRALVPLTLIMAFALGCSDDSRGSGGYGGNATDDAAATTSTTASAMSTTSASGSESSSGAPRCSPGAERPCYDGPRGTEGIGACHAGTETCDASGHFGACEAEVIPIAENCASPTDDDCDGAPPSCSGAHDWSKAFAIGGYGAGTATSIATDSAGNVVIAGYFNGIVSFGGEAFSTMTADIFVAKYDALGNYLWSKRFGSVDTDYGLAVATDAAGNVVVTGSFAGTVDFGGGPLTAQGGNVFLVKLDSSGNHLWSKHFGADGSSAAHAITVDSAGDVILAGGFNGTLDFGGAPLVCTGSVDIFVAKLDSAGNHLWSKRFGDANAASLDIALSVAVDAADRVVIGGGFQGTLNLGGAPLLSAGGSPSGGRDAFVGVLDASGNPLWGKRFGNAVSSSLIQTAEGVAVDAAGEVLVTGGFQGAVDFGGGALTSAGNHDIFLAKFDSMGEHLWAKQFGDAAPQEGTDVAFDAASNVLVTGTIQGGADFGGGWLGGGAFVAKLDASGNHLWSKSFGDLAVGFGVTTDAASNVLLTGYFNGTADFGGGPFSGGNPSSVFVAKLAP